MFSVCVCVCAKKAESYTPFFLFTANAKAPALRLPTFDVPAHRPGSFWGHNDNRADFSDPRRLLPELDDEMASRLCCGSWGS